MSQRDGALSVVSGDVNGDSFVDLMITSAYQTEIHLGNRDGRLQRQPPLEYVSGYFAAVGDLNFDGRDDLYVTGDDGTDYVTYSSPTQYSIVNLATSGVSGPTVLGDFGGSRRRVSGPLTATDIAALDFNGDQLLDCATSEGPTVKLYRNNGIGFTQEGEFQVQAETVVRLTTYDFGADGIPDLVAVRESAATLEMLRNNGAGNFSAGPSFVTGVARPVAAVFRDMDGDGLPDAVVRSASSGLSILRGLADGRFAPPSIITPGDALPVRWYSTRPLTINDLNGDGRPDIAFVSGAEVVTLLNNAPPRLTASMIDGVMVLRWQNAFARGAVLETSDSLDGSWTQHPFEPVIVGEESRAYDSGRAPMRFFRLRRPN